MTINAKFYTYCQEQECSVDVDLYSDDVLAPMFVGSVHDASVMNLKTHTLRTHCIIGQKYLVAFVPVKAEDYEVMEKEFNRAVNHYLDYYRKPRSKYVPELTSYEEWFTGDTYTDTGNATDIDNYLLSEMLNTLFEEVARIAPKYIKLLAALVDNDSELSQDVVFERAGMKRSTAYNHLPKLRKLVSQILDDIN